MPRTRAEEGTPDRLAAVLEELDAVRRAPGWVPTEDSVLDEPRSRVADLPRRVAATRQAERSRQAGRHAAGGGEEELRPREPLLRPPEPLIGAQVAPSRLAVIGALILVLVAGLVFGGRVLWAKASARPQPVTPTSTAPSGKATGASGAPTARQGFAAGSTAAKPAPTTLVVQVVGQVRKPGVVRVKAGSRVEDAVAAAGGALRGADLTAINLARPVVDGEQIHVPKPGEHPSTPPGPPAAGVAGSAGTAGSAGSTASAVVDLNTADEAALDGLPGVGPVTAQRILQWRAENGRFSSVDELGEVSGIGDKTLERLRPLVRVS